MILINKVAPISQIGCKAHTLLNLDIPNTPPLWVVSADFFSDKTQEPELIKELDSVLDEDKLYAVRSSAIDEDSDYASFAGVHDSFLNVRKKDVLTHIYKVYQSAFSPEALSYRNENNLSTENISIAVIIQEMVKAEISGVAFSINPVTNNPDEIILSVTHGYGEGLVNGSVSGSTYTINGEKIKIKGADILTKNQLYAVLRMVRSASEKLKAFVDVEFSLVGDTPYFLQARPIVAYKGIDPKNRTLLIDNANIIESYYGVTSPLTFTFAKDVYRDVYTATIKEGKVRKKILNELAPSLAEMLYCHEGKIYYNMNSWYHVNSIFPSKKANSQMEGMMGVKSSSSDIKKIKLNLWDMTKIGVIFVCKLIKIKKLSDRFEQHFDQIISPYYGKEISGSNDELKNLFSTIEKDIVPEFVVPIINDCGVMIHFGRLKEKAAKLNIPNETLNQYISNQGTVKSVGSATELVKIVDIIRSDKTMLDDFRHLSPEELCKKYLEGSKISDAIREYVLEYGARVGDELKLETITMIEDKTMIFSTLRQNLDITCTQTVYAPVSLPKKIRKAGERTKKFIKNRERLRLKRTKVYSVVRNIFLAYGRNYHAAGRLSQPDDIFYLTKDEVFSGKGDFEALVKMRKITESENAKKTVYDRFVFYGDKVLAVSNLTAQGELCGIPTGAGTITAPVRLMNSPDDTLLPGEIILTKRTDPGWISLFPRAAGLIVEHGSMLSHSFVVAREMNLPAVVGIENITSKIPDGTLVTLDGIKGVVTIEKT